MNSKELMELLIDVHLNSLRTELKEIYHKYILELEHSDHISIIIDHKGKTAVQKSFVAKVEVNLDYDFESVYLQDPNENVFYDFKPEGKANIGWEYVIVKNDLG